VLKHLIDRSPLPTALLPDDKRLVSAKEVCRRLGCGKTQFYAIRERYRELTPIDEFGAVLYRLDWVLDLLDQVGAQALNHRSGAEKGAAACLSN
jgi:hypothetical protein